MKKRMTKNVTLLALSAGLVGSSIAPASLTHHVHAKPSSNIDQVLSKLTPEQRQAIKQLQTNDQGGLQLSPEVDQKSNDTISVIVEFQDKPEKTAVLEAELEGKKLSKTKAKEKVDAAHETFQKDLQTIFKNDLKQKKSPFKIKQAYKHAFNGVAMTIPANKAKALLDSEAVKAVWSDKEVHIEPPVTEEESKQKEVTHTNTTFPGIEKLHHEGFTGEGVKVGILDTGIDYDHPDLQDAYKGGYDFVDNDNDPMETTFDDWVKAGKPATGTPYFTEHGTHVAGIIAGQGKNESDYAVTGVAPDADIYAYRVLGPQGTGSTGAILAGIDQAVEDDMDVINMSLGANYNDPLYVTSIAVNNAVLAGVTAVVSAGNSGNGMYTLGSPGTSPLALTVGANDTSVTIPTFTGTLHADENVSADLKLIARGFDDNIEELKGQNLQVVDGENGSYSDKDVKGKVILDTRGYIDLRSMIKNAKKEGAKALLLYNAYPLEDVYLGEGFDSLPVFSISDEKGAEMKEALASGSATFSFDELGDPVVTGGDVLADFSSRGPSRVLYDIKPEVTAPGVSVLSTVPSYVHGEDQIGNYKNAYERLSGTSMASPNVAGVAALLKQTDPDMTPAEIKTRLMNTAAPLNGDYSVFEVGAGRVDPYKAIHAQANIQVSDETKTSDGGASTLSDEGIQTIKETTGALSFGAKTVNGKHIRETRSVTLYNSSEEAKTFDVKVEFQTLGKRFDNDYSRVANDAKANGVTVETKDTLKVKAGKKKKTAVTMLVPKTADIGNYEGYVVYTNKENPDETYRVPFGIHTAEEGIDHIEVNPPAFTTAVEAGYNGIRWSVGLNFQLKSHMRSMDLFLVDPKTNKEIGFLGSFDGMGADENIEYYLRGVLNEGYYHPLTGNPDQPIAYDKEQTDPGLYNIRMVGTNDQGKTFTSDAPVYYSVTQPALDLNVDSGVVEYSPDQTTLPLNGSVYDPGVEEMKAGGMDVSQANNKFVYEFGRYSTEVPLDADGNFTTELSLIPGVSVLPVKMYAENMATVRNYSSYKQVYYVKQGTQYGTAIPDEKKVTAGDSVTVTLSMNNMTNMKQAVYSFVNPSNVDVTSINPHATLNGKLDIQTVNSDVTIDGKTMVKTTITATVTGDAGQTGVSGKVPMVDITYKVNEDSNALDTTFNQFDVSYTNIDDTMKSVTGISIPYHVERTYSVLKSHVFPEAFKNPWVPEEPLTQFDYVKAGTKVKVTDEAGKEYPNGFGIENYTTTAFFSAKLPLTDKPFTFEVETPGHFKVKKTFTVGLIENGEVKPYGKAIFPEPAPAGDVNQDNVIDVKDALSIQSNWDTDKREADINFDGVVDGKDMQFVINNYMMQNPWMDNSPEPLKTQNGQTLESVLEELNIQ